MTPRRRALLALPAAALGALVLTATFDPPCREAPPPLHADAAVVLSGDVDELRTKRGAALVLAGEARYLVLTGSQRMVGGDSALSLARTARAAGVPAERILCETQSRSTRENVLLVRPLLAAHGLRRVALVTSRSHLRRALWAARRAAPAVEWLPVSVPDAGSPGRRARSRFAEWLKLAGYVALGWA